MSALDDAVKAARQACIDGWGFGRGGISRRVIRTAVEAAAPILERAARERAAGEVEAFAKEAARTDSPDAIIGLMGAAKIVRDGSK